MKKLINLTKDVKKDVRDLMRQESIDAMLFHSSYNRLWFSRFPSSEGYLLVTKSRTVLYLDGRYITDGKSRAQNIDYVKEMPTNSIDGFAQLLKNDLQDDNVQTLGFESEYTNYQSFTYWNHVFNEGAIKQNCFTKLYSAFTKKAQSQVVLKPISVSKLRTIKDNFEANQVKEACHIADLVFADILKFIKPGVTEKDVEALILSSFIKYGAERASFDTIVASGLRGALPHGAASSKVINANELVTIDFGCVYNGYCSDTTRTICVGTKPNPKLKEIYQIVAQAQLMGIEAIKPGVKTTTIDQICRDYITEHGYGDYFIHSTGHGLGIEVHEYPRVSPFCDEVLQPGMIITVEPGIYIPELGGVRIEDDILVTEEGYTVLSQAQKKGVNLINVKNS